MLPLRSLVESAGDTPPPVILGIRPERLNAARSAIEEPATLYDQQELEFRRLTNDFRGLYQNADYANEVIAHLPEVLDGPHIIRYFTGVNLLLRRVLSDFRSEKDQQTYLEHKFPSAESLVLYYTYEGFVPNKPQITALMDEVFPSFANRDPVSTIFSAFERLKFALPDRSELELREVLFRFQRWYGIGGDTALLPTEKFDQGIPNKVLDFFKILYGAYLQRDFDDALEDHTKRQRRFAPKDGRGVYKQVKLQLHEDLIPILTEALAGGNRNAFIEEAIVEKLQREGVEFDLPEQPPLPNK